MKNTVEMGSGVMIYMPGFVKIGSGIQKFIQGCYTIHRQHGDIISQFFFQNKESARFITYTVCQV
jgi:hypothetical protein